MKEESVWQIALEAVDEKKAKDVVALDVREQSDICSFKLICSGDTDRHTTAIAESVEDFFKKKGLGRPQAVEGRKTGFWISLDYGEIVVHIFQKDIRNYYALEDLWKSCPRLSE